MTFEITLGTIYSAHFPFSDLSNKKKRPVLALSGKDENEDVRMNKTFNLHNSRIEKPVAKWSDKNYSRRPEEILSFVVEKIEAYL